MPAAVSINRMAASLALVAASGWLIFFVVTQARREPPVEAGTVTAIGSTDGTAPFAASHRSSDVADEITPVFDIARVETTGDAVIAGKAVSNATVELLRNGYVHDRAVADTSGQFVMVPPRLPPGDYELTLRSRQTDGKEATSKRSVMITLRPVASPMALDKEEADVALRQPDAKEATSKKSVAVMLPPNPVPITLDKQEDGITAYLHGDYAAALRLFQSLAEHGDASAQSNLGVMYEQGRGVAQNYRETSGHWRPAPPGRKPAKPIEPPR